jgi:anaerobic magnesium-protoporphyrin IX monomethyl ester cyclase
MQNILFVTPPYHAGVVESAGRWMPLSFVYLAGAVRAHGYEATIYDAMTLQHDMEEVAAHIAASNADVIAVSAITSSMPDSLEVMRRAKELHPEILTIVGGVHPTFCYEEILQDANSPVDIVVRGEGEETLPALLNALNRDEDLDSVNGIAYRKNGKLRQTPARAFISDLDVLPTAWDLVSWEDYRYFVIPDSTLAAVSTSRGCTHECTFCSQQKFWQKSWRGRDPGKVVEEIAMLKKKFGANVFLLVDEYPTSDQDRWVEFLDRMIHANLDVHLLMETRVEDIVRDADLMPKYRKAGIIHIYIGVEATSQETLDLVKKDLSVEESKMAIDLIHSQDMITETSFVLGFPSETKDSIETTLALAQHYNPDFAHFLAITPWPYADMFEDAKPFIKVHDYSRYNLVEPILEPEAMSLEDIRKAILDCYRRYYMAKVPEYITMKSDFKKDYLKRSMKLIMTNSFLADLVKRLGSTSDFSHLHHAFSKE